jgi:hypothetical protein
MAKSAFIVRPELTAIAVAYSNAGFIADRVAPRTEVMSKEFTYQKYALGDAFTAPETRVSRKGTPNQVEFSSTEVTDSVDDHALDGPVTNDDIEQWEKARQAGQTAAPSPLIYTTSMVTELVDLQREKRTANLIFNANSYATANKTTLSGTSQWSDPASDPQAAIGDALDTMVMRPNVCVAGRAAWTKLSRNIELCKAIFGNGTTRGQISKEAFCELFELEELLVGEGWVNTAAKGQPPVMTRLWGKHVAFLNRNKKANTKQGLTFAMTAQFGTRVAGTIEDPDIGMRGGQRVRSGESVKELVTANDLGYLFLNAVA